MNDDAPDTAFTACANCGKGEEISCDLKSCAACKLVKYCNRDCQIAHRPMHKKACKKRAAELHDEELFKEHLATDDCPICFLPLPLDIVQSTFKACCGKLICSGCIYAMGEEADERGKLFICAFCRRPAPSSEDEENERVKKLMEANNAYAFYIFAGCCARGIRGLPQNYEKANELYLRAGELGCAEAYCNLGYSYNNGRGVEVDKKKAIHYYELAAMTGDVGARYNLGVLEGQAGNEHRAYKHFILAAKAGFKQSLDVVKEGYMDGMVTKDEYANTLRAYQRRHDEMKSDQRDKVAASSGFRTREGIHYKR